MIAVQTIRDIVGDLLIARSRNRIPGVRHDFLLVCVNREIARLGFSLGTALSPTVDL
jgi:hypothetical protein